MNLNKKQTNIIIGIALLICFMPFISPAFALIMGIILSLLGVKNDKINKYTSFSLKASIVLLGFGMNLSLVINASITGFYNTAISVLFVLFWGYVLAKILKVDSKTATLISVGTAICGGSAIAAISPVINAKHHQTSFALIVVFVLNAIALIIFPIVGHYFHLNQVTFGNWAAIAIHDTSSVVGAGATYGAKSLEVATTVKLIRALWIIPLSIFIALLQQDKASDKPKVPWFIGLFILSILIANFFTAYASFFTYLNWIGKRGMVLALFLIGSSMSYSAMKDAGLRSFLMGILLWLLIGVSSFIVLYNQI
ncbi:MAG: putative sulfate exporter family transporter [Bacteroidales bacterium]|nr:putative sulfate exporter family transporter [Bacteroidales bacterium]